MTEFDFINLPREVRGPLSEVLVESFGFVHEEDFAFMMGPGGYGVMCRNACAAVVREVLPELLQK